MNMLILPLCLSLTAAAPPTVPVDLSTAEATATTTKPAMEYLGEAEYEAPLSRIPVLLLTPGEVESLLDDMQYRYGEDMVVLEEQGNQEGDDYQQWEDYDHHQEMDGEQGTEAGSRSKRQVTQEALDLALSHNEHKGNPIPVGRIHGRLDLNGVYKDRNNHQNQAGIGLGSVVYRSNNGRHSVGVGAYGTQGRGRYYGYGYKTQPQWGAGVGYRFRF